MMEKKLDLEIISEIIRIFKESDIAKLELSTKDFKIKLSKFGEFQAVPTISLNNLQPTQATQPPQESPKVEVKEEKNIHIVKSPIVGTFYRAPAPGAKPFVEVGSKVKKGDVLCIIEAMKIMNEIKSDVNGVVEEILVENGQPVEYGQPLFKIRLE
ncbi:MAG: acetyl-CoA carboxylase biotin carboxyl carrier protein [Candidatus Caldipriscus sp.]|nr:acetyl-CoA carboxylase biotin carboxyl carrier protein [Candidatus Caldipriscus sp.]